MNPPAGGVVLTARETARLIALLRLLSTWLARSSPQVSEDLLAWLRRSGATPPPGAGVPSGWLTMPGLSALAVAGACAELKAVLGLRRKNGGTS
jgi:hypothetical protein